MCCRAFILLMSSISCPLGSRWQRRMEIMEFREVGKSRWCEENMNICSFSPFLCLPVILNFNGLPKPPKTPQLPSRETLGNSTQLRSVPRLSCGQHSQSQASALRFQNLNIPKWSFQKRAPVEANASAVQLWGRQWGTGSGASENCRPRPHQSPGTSLCEWVCVCSDVDECSWFCRRFGNEYESVRRRLLEGCGCQIC